MTLLATVETFGLLERTLCRLSPTTIRPHSASPVVRLSTVLVDIARESAIQNMQELQTHQGSNISAEHAGYRVDHITG